MLTLGLSIKPYQIIVCIVMGIYTVIRLMINVIIIVALCVCMGGGLKDGRD